MEFVREVGQRETEAWLEWLEVARLREENASLVDAIDEYFASNTKDYTAGGHHYYCAQTRLVGPCDCAYGKLMDALAKAKESS